MTIISGLTDDDITTTAIRQAQEPELSDPDTTDADEDAADDTDGTDDSDATDDADTTDS